MGALIALIIIVFIFTSCKIDLNKKIDSKNPLDVDNTKMTRDICNGVSQSEIRRRYGNGYYDKTK